MSPIVGLVLRCELRRLLRDQRAVLFGLVLPAVAFPLLFLFSGNLEDVGREALEARRVRVAMDLAHLAEEDAAALREALADEELKIDLTERDLGQADEEGARAVFAVEAWDLLAVSLAPEDDGAPPALVLYQGDANEGAEEASDRVRAVARAVLKERRDARLVAAVGEDPGARYELTSVDVARAEDAAGLWIGSLLPLLAVLVLISGGSFAALDAFAGERESGTLETLFVQPAPAREVAWGKFLAVLATGMAAFLGNVVSLFVCLVLGLGELADVAEGIDRVTAATRLGIGCLLFLPTTALCAAVLSHVAARARTFSQGQLLTMPLTFIAMALTAPAMQASTELGPVLAIVPLTGAALTLRDAAAGAFAPATMLLSFAASTAWAALALRSLANTLDAERLLATPATSAEASARKIAAGRAIRFGLVASLLVYILGGRIQAAWPLGGLMATLWGLVLGLAVVAALGAMRIRREGERAPSLSGALGLTMPRPTHALGALLLAPALAQLVDRLFALQQRLLPLPSRVGESAELLGFATDLSLPALLFVMAVSPGVCEELLFRGSLLGAMKRDLPARSVILWQALLFGIVHASIYRFLPTAVVGAAAAAVALRAGSVLPAMLLHTGYNALLVAGAAGGVAWASEPWLALTAPIGLALLWRRKR